MVTKLRLSNKVSLSPEDMYIYGMILSAIAAHERGIKKVDLFDLYKDTKILPAQIYVAAKRLVRTGLATYVAHGDFYIITPYGRHRLQTVFEALPV